MPATSVSRVIDDRLWSGRCVRRSIVPKSAKKRKTTTKAKVNGTPWLVGIDSSNPPSTGPTIVAIWYTVLFQATALLNCPGGTIQGSKAVRDGAPRACADAFATNNK